MTKQASEVKRGDKVIINGMVCEVLSSTTATENGGLYTRLATTPHPGLSKFSSYRFDAKLEVKEVA